MPVDHTVDARELIAFLELLDGGFQHPQMSMVVEEDLFSESIIPQAQHDIDEHLTRNIFSNRCSARHAVVVIGVGAKVERRQ